MNMKNLNQKIGILTHYTIEQKKHLKNENQRELVLHVITNQIVLDQKINKILKILSGKK